MAPYSYKEPRSFQDLIGNDQFDWFVDACKTNGGLAKYEPDSIVWNQRQNERIDFRVLLDGCVAVWGSRFKENTIDALIVPGQLMGDFELFDYSSDNFELRSLSNCTIARASQEIVDELRKRLGNERFYEVLSELFIVKLLFQNKVVKWRHRNLKRRLAKFIDAFVHEKMWRELTTLGNVTSIDPNQIEKFGIELIFDIETLSCILTCDPRVFERLFGKWANEEIIKVELFNKSFLSIGYAELKFVDKKPHIYNPPKGTYFKVFILDYRALRSEVDLY